MQLKLNGLRVACIIGERPEERTREQELVVNIALQVADAPAESDRLADAVDYADLAGRIRAELVAARCQLIERAARVVHGVCTATPGVCSASVAVLKAGTVPGLGSAEVVYP